MDTEATRYWDRWNRDWRFHDRLDSFMQSQLDAALAVVRDMKLENGRILGIGCGTGWLENRLLPFGQVWGTDLSAEAIAEGQRRFPGVSLVCGDFMQIELSAPFDLILSADSFAQMPDHEACLRRIAGILRPGGILLLMTQNPWVWSRRSKLRPLARAVPHADPRDWPSLGRIRALLRKDFSVVRVSTFSPGGDTGILWWVENAFVERVAARALGLNRWRRLLEALRLGRELVVVARRKG